MVTVFTASLLCFAASSAFSKELEISGEAFLAARNTFHEAWFERADEQFADLLVHQPDHALSHAYAAVIDRLLYRDNKDRIARSMELARTAPSGEAMMAQALAGFAAGDLHVAETRLREFLRTYPGDRFAQHVLGFTLIDQGRTAKGVRVLLALLDEHPGYYQGQNHLAYGLSGLGEHEASLDAADAFLAGNPANPSAWDTRADMLMASGRTEDAIASLTRAMLLEPRFAYGWKHLGDILSETGRMDLAQAAYQRAIETATIYGPAFTASVKKKMPGPRE